MPAELRKNLFFTGCPPCRMEFPCLQEAWEENSDRVAVIALTPDEADTDEVLRAFADELGLGFPIAHEAGTGLYERYVTRGFPTSILVDGTGRVIRSECGALSSKEAFVALFDACTGEDCDPNTVSYTVRCRGAENGEAIAGVILNFCTDTACTPVTTSEEGGAVFVGPPARYHVQIVRVPDGWQPAGEAEWTTEPYGETFWIPFTEVGE